MPRRSERDKQDGTVIVPVFQREDLLGSIPWIAVVPSSSKQSCHALKGSAPLYAHFKMSIREDTDPEYAAKMQQKRETARDKHMCKKKAHWAYVFENGAVKLYCTDHVYAHGIWGYHEEYERFQEWYEVHYKPVED